MLSYREIAPSRALRRYLSTFWLLELDGTDTVPQRVVPDGHAELILNWAEPFDALAGDRWHGQPRCFLAGQIDGPLLLKPKGPTKILGIGFLPHGAAALFRQPMHELSGRFTPVGDFSPVLAGELSRALDSPDPIRIIEAAFLARANFSRREDPLPAAAVRRLTDTASAPDIRALARDFGLSTRQFERRFQNAVGLSPKLFSKLQRFNKVFRVIEGRSCNWVDTALECGYYDQAHLIRDCKRFSGITPVQLFAEDGDLARHFYQRYGMSHLSKTARRYST